MDLELSTSLISVVDDGETLPVCQNEKKKIKEGKKNKIRLPKICLNMPKIITIKLAYKLLILTQQQQQIATFIVKI